MVRPQQISTEKIVDVARKIFFERGISVSMQVIADEVGLSQPALFKRFKTKNDLVFAALAPPEKLPLLDWINDGPQKGDLNPQLIEMLTKLWETLQWILPRMMILKTGNIDPEEFHKQYKTPPLIRLLRAVSNWLEKAQESGQLRQGGNPDSWAQAILGSQQGRAVLQHILRMEFGPEDDGEYIKDLGDLFLKGMNAEKDND